MEERVCYDDRMKVGWKTVKLGDFIDFLGGGTPDKKNPDYWNGDIKWASVKDVKNKYLYTTQDTITELGLKNSSSQLAKDRELILVTRISPGKCVIAKDNIAINQDLKIVKLKADVSTSFVYYFFTAKENEFIKRSSGTTVKGIRLEEIRIIEIDLPPLPEQRAIVSKIEQLFSELDNGIFNLKLAQEQLKVYRQAVLKKAFKGELTKKWREQQTDLPDARDLLEQIRKEREEAAKISGEKLKKVKSLTETEVLELSKLPEEWTWIRVEGTSSYIVDCLHSTAKFVDSGFYCIDTTCIENGRILFEEARFVNEETYKDRIRRLKPEGGDILFAREGTVGTTVITPENINLCLGQRMMMFRPLQKIIPKFFMYYFQSTLFSKQYKPLITGTTSPHLNIRDIIQLKFPLCSLPEQQAIVQEIETRLSICDKIEQDIETNLEKAEALRQSILKKAFEGKLLNERELAEVRKAEDWEPAEVLLEKIKVEKTRK